MLEFLTYLQKHERLFIIFAIAVIVIAGAIPVATSIPTPSNPITDFITPPLPVPPVNKSSLPPKNSSCPAVPAPCMIRLAAGGDVRQMTSSELDKLKALGIKEVHVVVPDAQTYPNVLAAIKSRNMTPVYDGEVPFWQKHNSNLQYSIIEINQLEAIYNTGWHNFASEGLYAIQVAQINSIGFHYYNYGGELGDNLYTNPRFGPHQEGSHWANYEEFYNRPRNDATFSTIMYQSEETPATNGITFGLWTYTPSGQSNPLFYGDQWVTAWNDYGTRINTVLFWCGLNQHPSAWIGQGGVYSEVFNNIKELRQSS